MERWDDREAVVRRVVRLIFLTYWLLIFEGVLRKWAFPQAQQYLFFIRDPVVLLVYFYSFKHRLWPRTPPPPLVAIVALAIAGIALVMFGVLQNLSLTVLVYGWRNYFFYAPLAFIIGAVLETRDLERLVRNTLLIAIPIAVLVVFQFLSPKDEVVNAGLIDVYQPGVYGEIVRTYGTFTSSAGESPFVASLAASLLVCWILPKSQRPLRGPLLVVASIAVVTCLALSGSREAFTLVGVVLLAALASSFAMKQFTLKIRALLLPLIAFSAAALLLASVFAEAWQALAMRATIAYATESAIYAFGTLGRAFSAFSTFIPLLFTTPLVGYGIGTFGNAFVVTNSWSLLPSSVIVEDDWARNVAELGPILGLLYISFRIALVAWLVRGAVVATTRSSNPMPLVFVGFCGILLLIGQITGQGSVNGFAWLYAGFCIAANRLYASPFKGA